MPLTRRAARADAMQSSVLHLPNDVLIDVLLLVIKKDMFAVIRLSGVCCQLRERLEEAREYLSGLRLQWQGNAGVNVDETGRKVMLKSQRACVSSCALPPKYWQCAVRLEGAEAQRPLARIGICDASGIRGWGLWTTNGQFGCWHRHGEAWRTAPRHQTSCVVDVGPRGLTVGSTIELMFTQSANDGKGALYCRINRHRWLDLPVRCDEIDRPLRIWATLDGGSFANPSPWWSCGMTLPPVALRL